MSLAIEAKCSTPRRSRDETEKLFSERRIDFGNRARSGLRVGAVVCPSLAVIPHVSRLRKHQHEQLVAERTPSDWLYDRDAATFPHRASETPASSDRDAQPEGLHRGVGTKRTGIKVVGATRGATQVKKVGEAMVKERLNGEKGILP